VYPEEVEEVLKEHDLVRDAVVVGVPDERFGEVIVAWIEPVGDVDGDGDVDEADVIAHVKSRLAGYRQRPLIYHHDANGAMREIGVSVGGAFTRTYNSRGLAIADLNNDGQMDVVFTNQEERPAVLMNQGVPGNWIEIKLRGTKSNRSAIGARVTLRAGDRTLMREVKSGASFLSQSDLRVHFGLGDAKAIDELKIRWPSGRLQVEKPPRLNQITVITEK